VPSQLAPHWEKMAQKWKDHEIVLIGEFDCRANAANERFCSQEMEIFGLPSLLYGDASHGGQFLQSYGDEKKYADLDMFVNQTLSNALLCSPGNVGACDAMTQDQLNMFWKMSASQLQALMEEKEKAIDDALASFKKEFGRMQAIYDESAATNYAETAKRKANIKMLRSVLESRK
jgi:hypothetical protein